MTAFNSNPTTLQHTLKHGYDVVAGDIVQVVRGKTLYVLGLRDGTMHESQ